MTTTNEMSHNLFCCTCTVSTFKMADCYFLSTGFCAILFRVVLGVQYFAGLSDSHCVSNTCPRPEQTLSKRPDILPSLVADCYRDGTEVLIVCNHGFRSVSNYTTVCNGDIGEFEAGGTCRIDLLTVLVAAVLGILAIAVCAVLCYIIQIFKRHKTKGHDIPNDVARNEPVIRAVYRAYNEPEPVVELCFGRRQDNRDMACQTEPVRFHQIYENTLGEGARIYENLPAI